MKSRTTTLIDPEYQQIPIEQHRQQIIKKKSSSLHDATSNDVELVGLVDEGGKANIEDSDDSVIIIGRQPRPSRLHNIFDQCDNYGKYSLITSFICIILSIAGLIIHSTNNTTSYNDNDNNNIFSKAIRYIAIQLSSDFIINFLAGGISGAVAKTCTGE